MRIIVRGFSWDTAGTTFANMVNSLFSGDARVDWTGLGETAAAAIGGPLETIRSAVSTFSFGDAAQAFADTVNGFFSNEQLWADAGTIVSESIKGLFTWGTDFLNGLDIDQIAEDVRAALESVDWPGIAESIWNFLGSALDKLGELIWKIIFGPDTNSAEFVHEGEERFNELLGQLGIDPIEVDIRFGLDLNNPQESEWYNELQQAIQDSLRAGEWIIPLDPSIPPEAVELARQEFVYQWNKLHPEAPIDVEPDVPPDAGDKVKGLWDKMKPSLKSDVDPELPSDSGDKVKGLWDETKPELKADVGYTLSPADSNQTLAKKIGTALGVLYTLSQKDNNQTLASKIGTALNILYTLNKKDNSQTLASKIGTSLGVLYTLSKKDNNQTLASKIGTALTVLYTLTKHDNNQTLSAKIGTSLSVLYTLTKHDKNQTLASKIGTSLSVAVSLTTSNLSSWIKTITDAINKALKKVKGKAGGGAITNSGREIDFASGGVIRGGMARYLANVPHYAGGTTRAHGTVFVAGEAGPEIMGHINGRTEILNKSQLAQAIYSAVVAGMGQAVNALGTFLAGQMATCTNAITGTIGNMSAIRSLEYHAPVMATGSVMPYEVSAQIAKTGEDIQDTLNSNNEDLIQTIISVAGQIVAAMHTSGRNNAEGTGQSGLTVQQVIRQINQRTQMFGGSPLLG